MVYNQFHSRSSRRPLIIIGIAVLLIVIGSIALYKHHEDDIQVAKTAALEAKAKAVVKPTNTVDYSAPKSSDNAANEQRKDNPSQAATTLNNGPTMRSTTPEPSITITRAGKDPGGQNLQVASLVEGATSGTCTITATKQGQSPVSRQVMIEQQGNSYTCPVVNIPLSDFPEKGNWNITASISSNGQAKTTSWAANPVSL